VRIGMGAVVAYFKVYPGSLQRLMVKTVGKPIESQDACLQNVG